MSDELQIVLMRQSLSLLADTHKYSVNKRISVTDQSIDTAGVRSGILQYDSGRSRPERIARKVLSVGAGGVGLGHAT